MALLIHQQIFIHHYSFLLTRARAEVIQHLHTMWSLNIQPIVYLKRAFKQDAEWESTM